ncbi:MAG: hypothetical protein MI922_16330 [Bacteroidales bacterium]|nr:hypothetical protein [Bacteroidales bacterium]
MKRIILFRYHKDFELIKQRVKLIRLINPEVSVHGLYGGEINADGLSELENDCLDSNYTLTETDSEKKWMHADVQYIEWYKKHGQDLEFDWLHVVEWDLLMLDRIENLYPLLMADEVPCTGLIELKEIEKTWYWGRNEMRRQELDKLVKYFNNNLPNDFKLYGMLGPGVTFSRYVMQKLSELEFPVTDINEELRIPVLIQMISCKLTDTKFYRKWFSSSEEKIFNATGKDIKLKTIEKELKKKGGRRVFHPYRDYIDADNLYKLYTENSSI